jgi:hypothetical protein
MWFSPRAGPLGIFGKSKLDAAKEIMAPYASPLLSVLLLLLLLRYDYSTYAL